MRLSPNYLTLVGLLPIFFVPELLNYLQSDDFVEHVRIVS